MGSSAGRFAGSYPAGVPAEVDTGEFASVGDLFLDAVARFPDRPAFTNLGRTLSFTETERASRDFAAYLTRDLGLTRGDRLAIMLPNLLQYPVVLFGAMRAGVVVVNINPLYTARELHHQLTDSGASAMVILETCARVLQNAIHGTGVRSVVVTGVGDALGFPRSALVNAVVRYAKRAVPRWSLPGAVRWRTAMRSGAALPFDAPAVGQDEIAFLQYTGGTTGASRGAVLTHGNMVANVLQAGAWIGQEVRPGREVMVTALPLYHIFALTANALTFLHAGAENLLITNPRDQKSFVRELSRSRFTYITGVDTLFRALLDAPGFDRLDFSSLRLGLGAGMALRPEVAARWQEVTGVPAVEGYGLTEASPAVCLSSFSATGYTGNVGPPLPSTECEVRAPDGEEVPFGEIGELCVRGPQVMREYWNRPKETAAVLGEDGWLRTGDLATMDAAGFVKIVGRAKEMAIVSGFNVYPDEVEEVVGEHPGVAEAGAVGVPDEKSGETMKVVIVRRDPALTAEEVRAFCRERLAAYKVPRVVEFREALPKSAVGKILRRELR
ncbi:MAG: AMP-binding protein [Gemmatimonadota bacterium]|nr:long-chain-fatty-acid--CoA ligase [Gemmatimonadota bacterium]MDP6528967.1 AMP-binding protein [Gemmatimonadota bacterium]MDP6802035.1 AMP-binding protein [Gemmatimonadota bacterium]MDP7031383.1 AMP-binding protein [Gemmatimonadota bacterium]